MISVREKLNQSQQLLEDSKKKILSDNYLQECNQIENKFKETIIKQQEFIVHQQSQIIKLQEENENLKNNCNNLKNNNSNNDLNLRFYELKKYVSKLELEKECLYEIIKNIQNNQIQSIVVSLGGDIASNKSISVPSSNKSILHESVNNLANINPSTIKSKKDSIDLNNVDESNLLNNFEKEESMKNVINELNKHFKNNSLESEL